MSQAVRTVNIKGKEYVDVAERVRLVHADAAGFSMLAQERYEIAGRWFFSVTIDVKGCMYRGDAEIKFDAKPGSPDATNPVECAQTSALGRALGFAGYGALDSIASADEVQRALVERERLKLDVLVKRTKKRAMALGVATDAETWATLLAYCGVEEIREASDLEVVNLYLNDVEQGAQQEAS